jgi:hypothetical protein
LGFSPIWLWGHPTLLKWKDKLREVDAQQLHYKSIQTKYSINQQKYEFALASPQVGLFTLVHTAPCWKHWTIPGGPRCTWQCAIHALAVAPLATPLSCCSSSCQQLPCAARVRAQLTPTRFDWRIMGVMPL